MAEGASSDNSWESWLGGWVQAAKEKSSTAYEFVKKDLTEFSTTVQKETEKAIEKTSLSLSKENTEQATTKVKAGITSFLGNISKVLVIPPADEYVPVKVSADGTTLYDRGKARLHAIQLDIATYADPPRGSKEQFEMWLTSFDMDLHKGEISEILVSKVEVRALYTKLVPNEVSHAEFWQRYFYRVHQLDCDEARKQALMQRADRAHGDNLNWDDDDDDWSEDGDEEDDGNQSDWEKMPRPQQSKQYQHEPKTPLTTTPASESSSPEDRKTEPTSTSSPSHEQQVQDDNSSFPPQLSPSPHYQTKETTLQQPSSSESNSNHDSSTTVTTTPTPQQHETDDSNSTVIDSSDIALCDTTNTTTITATNLTKSPPISSPQATAESDLHPVHDYFSAEDGKTASTPPTTSTNLQPVSSSTLSPMAHHHDEVKSDAEENCSTPSAAPSNVLPSFCQTSLPTDQDASLPSTTKACESSSPTVDQSDKQLHQSHQSESHHQADSEPGSTSEAITKPTTISGHGNNSREDCAEIVVNTPVGGGDVNVTDPSLSTSACGGAAASSEELVGQIAVDVQTSLIDGACGAADADIITTPHSSSPQQSVGPVAITTVCSAEAEENSFSSTLNTPPSPLEVQVPESLDIPTAIVFQPSETVESDDLVGKGGDNAEAFPDKTVEDDVKELAVKVKGDMVVVGGKETPSSESSEAKASSGLDEDWDDDFDVEVTEEDLKAAEDIARKLGENLDADDDDWENWD